MEYHFYALGIDPQNYRYIGVTRQARGIEARFVQHKRLARSGKTKMPIHDWLKRHIDEARIFDLGTGPLERESELIAAYRSAGHELLNVTEGGMGTVGYTASAEARAARSERMKGNRRCAGLIPTPEHREKIRQSLLGRKCPDDCTCGRHSPKPGRGANISAAIRAGDRIIGGHVRWHVNRGTLNPDCRFCQEAP